MTSVNTNVGAINAQLNMVKNQKDMETAMARLSSGLRINTAADDAAGTSISTKLESQIRGLTQAIRNAEDGQNLIDTVEGAHVEILNSLQRLRELAVQSSNASNDSLDRNFINAEATQLILEINRIASDTQWNDMNVLDGTFTSKSFQIGNEALQKVDVTVTDVSAAKIGAYEISGFGLFDSATGCASAQSSAITGTDIIVAGYLGTSTLVVDANDQAKDVVALFNAQTSSTGVDAKAVTHARLQSISASGTVDLTIGLNGSTATAVTVTATVTTDDLTALRDAINAAAGETGVTAETTNGDLDRILLRDIDGDSIVLSNFNHSTCGGTIGVVAYDFDASTVTDAQVNIKDATTDSITINGAIKLNSHEDFRLSTVGAGEFFSSTATSVNASLSTVGTVDLTTSANAQNAIDVLDGAINAINDQRSYLGAISNRLDKTINNLSNIVENTTESKSHIADADFAAETSRLTKSQILSQAATSMLAQANASKQTLLALLQN